MDTAVRKPFSTSGRTILLYYYDGQNIIYHFYRTTTQFRACARMTTGSGIFVRPKCAGDGLVVIATATTGAAASAATGLIVLYKVDRVGL